MTLNTIKDKLSQFREREEARITIIIKDLLGDEKWLQFSENTKQEIIDEIKKLSYDPEVRHHLRNTQEILSENKNLSWSVIFLMLGTIIGVSGNLVANSLDRYFLKFNNPLYDAITAVIFIIIVSIAIYLFNRILNERVSKILTNNTSLKILSVLEKYEKL